VGQSGSELILALASTIELPLKLLKACIIDSGSRLRGSQSCERALPPFGYAQIEARIALHIWRELTLDLLLQVEARIQCSYRFYFSVDGHLLRFDLGNLVDFHWSVFLLNHLNLDIDFWEFFLFHRRLLLQRLLGHRGFLSAALSGGCPHRGTFELR